MTTVHPVTNLSSGSQSMSKLFTASLVSIFVVVLTSLQGCAPQANSYSRVSVTNSSPASAVEFQAVVKLYRYEANAEPVICTGSFLDSTRILTAAHCLGNSDSITFDVEWTIDGVTVIVKPASVLAVHPQFKKGGKAIQPSDLAILSIDAGEELLPLPLSVFSAPIKVGAEVTLVGYGNESEAVEDSSIVGAGSGIKRVGRNRIYTSTRSGLIIVSGDPGRCFSEQYTSVTADGDSGGPVLIDSHIAGVTIGGGTLPPQPEAPCPKAVSYFANLQLQQNAEFISNTLKENL